jgi:hypothetical protein
MTLTDGDRLIISIMLMEGEASPEDIDIYLRVLAEGVRLGEIDSIQHVQAFRRRAMERTDGLDLVVEVGRLEDTLPRLKETAEFVSMVTHTKPGGQVHDFIALRNISEAAQKMASSREHFA